MMTNVDQLFMGMEFGFESNITSSLQFTGAFTMGDYLYNSRPIATVTRDNSQEVVHGEKCRILSKYKIGGMLNNVFTSLGPENTMHLSIGMLELISIILQTSTYLPTLIEEHQRP